jgi:hypothetical protein
LPSVNRLHAELKDRGLSVLLVSFRENADLVRRTARERGYTAPVLLDRTGDVTGKLYGVWGPPTAYLIVGERDWNSPAARALLAALLDAPAR